jgi:hypothetical protein
VEAVNAADMRILEAYNQTRIPGTLVLTAIKNHINREMAVIVNIAGTAVNYCAQIVGFDPVNPTDLFTVMPDGSGFFSNAVLDIDNQNRDISAALVRTAPAYINPAARFDACLIYNNSGTVIGIYMEEKRPARATNVP